MTRLPEGDSFIGGTRKIPAWIRRLRERPQMSVFDLSTPGTERDLLLRAMYLIKNNKDEEVVGHARRFVDDYKRLNRGDEEVKDEPGYDGVGVSVILGESIDPKKFKRFTSRLQRRSRSFKS